MPSLRKKRKSKLKGYKFWHKKLDALFSALIRSKGMCEWCGSTTNQMNCSHVISRSNKTLRWDVFNAMCLCTYCHRFRWHDNPLEAQAWFQEKFSGRYAYLMKAKDVHLDRLDGDFAKLEEAILNREIRELVTCPYLLENGYSV